MKRLKESLPAQEDYLLTYSPGLFRVIDYAHHSCSSAQINWSSFTLEEAKLALEMAMEYVEDEAAVEENFDSPPNVGNAVHEYLHSTEIIYQIRNSKPERNYKNSMFF